MKLHPSSCIFATASLAAILVSHGAYAQVAAPAKLADEVEAVEEVVVTGTRLTNGFNAPTPVSVIGAAQIENRGAANIAEAVQEIPSFRPSGPTQGVSGTFSVGQSILDLRALGATRTLVLVDGHRHVPNNVNGTFDTNTIPVSLVERTEVVTGGASAAYGSDAVAGVVNFILRDKLQGLRGNLQYGISQQNDIPEWSGSIGFGTSFAEGRGHIIVGADASKNDMSGNMYNRDWGRKEPGLVPLSSTRPAGTPAFVIGNGTQYVLAPGSLITSCQRGTTVLSGAACPVNGLTFDASGTPYPFQFGPLVGTTLQIGPSGTAGNYGYNTATVATLKVGGDRRTFLTKANYQLTPNTKVFGQFSYGRFQVDSRGTHFTRNANTILINRDNPYIPASLAAQMDAGSINQIRMNRLNDDFGSADPHNENKFTEFAGGARGTVFGNWKWDASFVTGRSKFRYDIGGLAILPNYYAALYAVKDTSGNIVCGPMATNPNRTQLNALQLAALQSGCVPFNPFGLKSMSVAAWKYTTPRMFQFTDYARDSASANIAGEPFSTSAGPVSIAAGAEWRRDDVKVTVPSDIEALSIAQAWSAVNPRSGSGQIMVSEGYIEAGVPIVRDLPLMKTMDLNGAIRVTNYSTSGTVSTWKVGGTWEPSDSLRFRITRSHDIRAPNVPELFVKGNDSFGLRANPKTGVSAQLNGASLNNPALQPEEAETFTMGAIIQPTWKPLQGFRASIDYYNIQINNVISALSFTEVLDRYYMQGDTSVAQYISFDNSAIGFSRVDSPLLNLNKQKTDGVDIELAYRAPQDLVVPGRVSVSALGSWLDDLETFDAKGVGLGDLAGAIPEWRWTVNLTHDLGRLSTNIQVRTTSVFKYLITRVGPDDQSYNPSAANSINRNQFPAMAYTSLSARYAIINTPERRLEAYGVIDNLFDLDPPAGIWAVLSGLGTGGSGGYNPYDGIGRYFKAGIRFQY